jgi:pimeloyl-ACP methyl ester carboxylesterase
MEFMAGAVKVLLENLNIKKVFLSGHSLGGYVALAFLDLYPDMLNGYCLLHSHPFADRPETAEKREKEIKVVRAAKKYLLYPENISQMFASVNIGKFKEELQRSKDIASTIPDEGLIAVLNGMMNRPSRLKTMETGKVPCLWILGRMDNYIPCEEIQKKVNLPSNAEVVVLENSGHMGFVEEEDLVVEAMVDFIGRQL